MIIKNVPEAQGHTCAINSAGIEYSSDTRAARGFRKGLGTFGAVASPR